MGELYRNCDLDTVVNFLAKQVRFIEIQNLYRIKCKWTTVHIESFRMCRSWQRRTRRRWGRSWCNSAPPYSPATGRPFVWPLVSVNDWWCDDTGKRVLKRGMIWYFFSGKTVRAQAARASWSCLSAWSCCPSTPTASWRATHSRAAGGPGCTFYKRWNDLIPSS